LEKLRKFFQNCKSLLKIMAMLSIVINAGGASTRMGENKALKLFAGEPLIARMVRRLRPLASDLWITTNSPEAFQFLGLPTMPDLKPGYGALSGLYTAIVSARQVLVAVVACDMPYIDPRLLAVQRDLADAEGADVVLPLTPEGMEPLHAIYRRDTCLPAIEAAIAADQRRLVAWLPAVKVREMPPKELAIYDPQFRSFINVNTPEEFRQAELLDQ
jgi:molybdopterin-guanine dinucleotide biosynthesis protein A